MEEEKKTPETQAETEFSDRKVLEERVEEVLDKIRPYIQHDGGDIELLGIDENNIVYVSFLGACAGCIMAADDFAGGVKLLLLDEVEGIRDVILI